MDKLNRYDYVKSVVEVHVLEKTMITKNTMEELLKEKNIETVFSVLTKAGYFKGGKRKLTKHNYDELLMESVEDFTSHFLDSVHGVRFLDMIFLEYDIYNIKSILMKNDTNLNYPSQTIKLPRERALYYEEIETSLPPIVPSQYDILYKEAKEVYEEKGSKGIQEYLDRKFFALMLEIAVKSEIPMFLSYAKSRIDFYNILFVFRAMKIWENHGKKDNEKALPIIEENLIKGGRIPFGEILDLPFLSQIRLTDFFENSFYGKDLIEGIRVYGYDKDLSILEKCMDNYLIHLCKDYQFTALGPEPIFGYLIGRKYEVINIRLILTALFLKVPEEIIRERLRDSYV